MDKRYIPYEKNITAPLLLFFGVGGDRTMILYIFISKGGGCGAVVEMNASEQCERR